jgi:spermidine/putrescine-binding protein
MRKIAFFICLFLICFTVSGCGQREKLLLLNWGEYINDEIITMFEEKYNCNVILNIADSNELFYAKIKSGTTVYDLVIPSEYMVERMVQNDLLQKVDYSKLTNYDPVNNPYLPGVIGIQNQMFEGYEDYAVPYFWGTFGLMYNKKVNGLEEAVKKYGWKGYFEPELLQAMVEQIDKLARFAFDLIEGKQCFR